MLHPYSVPCYQHNSYPHSHGTRRTVYKHLPQLGFHMTHNLGFPLWSELRNKVGQNLTLDQIPRPITHIKWTKPSPLFRYTPGEVKSFQQGL